MMFDLLSEKHATALCISRTLPKRVRLGGKAESLESDNLVDKVFHDQLETFSYTPGFENEHFEKIWLFRATIQILLSFT